MLPPRWDTARHIACCGAGKGALRGANLRQAGRFFPVANGGWEVGLDPPQDAADDYGVELRSARPGGTDPTEAALGIRGGWTLRAAEAVCAGDGLEGGEVLDLLASLVDKSLVLVTEQDGEARYRLLETVRQYSQEKLEETGEDTVGGRPHAEFFLKLAERAEPELKGHRQVVWLDRLETDPR
jgi:hypothetical protein